VFTARYGLRLYIWFYVRHTRCICVFCIYLRTNSDLCHLQHTLIGFYNRDEKCLLRGTDCGFIYDSTFCTHGVFVCFVFILEQTATCATYSINWLVFITEVKSVYSAVRTGPLYMFIFLIVKRDLLSVYQAYYCLGSVLLIILHFYDFSDSGCKWNA
jgi:hypothetical protein